MGSVDELCMSAITFEPAMLGPGRKRAPSMTVRGAGLELTRRIDPRMSPSV